MAQLKRRLVALISVPWTWLIVGFSNRVLSCIWSPRRLCSAQSASPPSLYFSPADRPTTLPSASTVPTATIKYYCDRNHAIELACPSAE